MIGILFLGAPCSGKSMLAKLINTKINETGHISEYVSSGDIARKMQDQFTVDSLKQGGLADESRMRALISATLEVNQMNGMKFTILDGFPRFYDQYDWLKSRSYIEKIIPIYIKVPEHELINRSLSRNRFDDNIDIFTKRLNYFNDTTLAMINKINTIDNSIVSINGSNAIPIDHVLGIIMDIITRRSYVKNSEV